jgi:hypothetical protein
MEEQALLNVTIRNIPINAASGWPPAYLVCLPKPSTIVEEYLLATPENLLRHIKAKAGRSF